MKVLMVGDSPTPRRLLEGLGHECFVAEDGVRGWEAFQDSGADVVISDSMMPGMDGHELCRRVRSDASAPYAYFILLTSPDNGKHSAAGREAGVDDYMTKPFSPEELATRLVAATRVNALHRRLAAQQAELERLKAVLLQDSRLDPLTGLGNRLRQDEDLETLAGRAERYGHSFGVALFDVDRFKAFNEAAGGPAGDDLLRAVALALVGQCRRGDAVYRHGGEQLLVVFPDQSLEGTATGAERMREVVEGLAIPHPGIQPAGAVTVSAGIARFEATDGDDVPKLLARAEDALHAAKEAGRNRIVTRERASDWTP